jgi:hypothetical protein
MISTKMYLFHQRHPVILLDTSGEFFNRRYRNVYSHNLKAHRGTDNQILIEFLNQDQKRVDVTGKEFVCRLISHDGEELLLEKSLEMVNAGQGQTKLVLTEQELDNIMPQTVSYSVELIGTSINEPVFVDESASARGNMEILDSVMPKFVESKILTVPDHGVNTTYVSSILSTDDSQHHTFQLDLDSFSGLISIEGAAESDGQWYTVATESLTMEYHKIIDVVGYHPYLRFTITESAGTLIKILYR